MHPIRRRWQQRAEEAEWSSAAYRRQQAAAWEQEKAEAVENKVHLLYLHLCPPPPPPPPPHPRGCSIARWCFGLTTRVTAYPTGSYCLQDCAPAWHSHLRAYDGKQLSLSVASTAVRKFSNRFSNRLRKPSHGKSSEHILACLTLACHQNDELWVIRLPSDGLLTFPLVCGVATAGRGR